MKKKQIIIISAVIILAILLVWGLIGSSKAAELGIDCDIGIGKDGSVFCWKWHQNALGNIQEGLKNLFGK